MISINLYSFLILFASISSFNLGLFYLIKSLKNGKRPYLPLGTIIFSICLFFSYYEITGLFLKHPQIMWMNAPLLFSIGPLFYLYVKSDNNWFDIIHFLPFLLVLIWIFPFYIKPAIEKLDIIKTFFSPKEKPEVEIMQYLYILHIGCYCLLGYLTLKKKNKLSQTYNSSVNQYRVNRRSESLYLIVSIFAIVSFTFSFISDLSGIYYGSMDRYTILLLVVLILLLQVYFSINGYDENLENEFKKSQKKNAPKNIVINDANYEKTMSRLDTLMNSEKLFRNPNLKINTIAEKLGVSMHFLSATINNQTGNNFFDYVNTFRVDELKCNLLLDSNSNYTLFAIAKESGFKSNSSFYRVFKKYTGYTPKAFIEKYKTSPFT